jgi:hypothetical protein
VIFQAVGAIGFVGGLVFLVADFAVYHEASRALSNRDYAVEGVVTDFAPMHVGGHAVESFRINGVNFSYGGGWGSTVFNSDWNKGPFTTGLTHEFRIVVLTFYGLRSNDGSCPGTNERVCSRIQYSCNGGRRHVISFVVRMNPHPLSAIETIERHFLLPVPPSNDRPP